MSFELLPTILNYVGWHHQKNVNDIQFTTFILHIGIIYYESLLLCCVVFVSWLLCILRLVCAVSANDVNNIYSSQASDQYEQKTNSELWKFFVFDFVFVAHLNILQKHWFNVSKPWNLLTLLNWSLTTSQPICIHQAFT